MNRHCAYFSHGVSMQSVGHRLKELRLRATPSLSIRQIAEKLGMGHSSYNFYENEKTYKKPYLPIDFTRKVAAVLAEHNIDPIEVMKLAGLSEKEAAPEAQIIESSLPEAKFISLPIMLPSEAALADMFETMLALVPKDATRAEAAQILAQRLPSGFAAIGPIVPVQAAFHAPVAAAPLQSGTTDHPVTAQQSRTE